MNSNKASGGNFRDHRGGVQPGNPNNSDKVPEKIRKYIQGEEMEGKIQYEIFSLKGSIKTEYCERAGNEAKMNQLRKFYDQILSINDDLVKGAKTVDGKLIRIVPIAKYAKARGLIDDKLMNLIDDSIGIISGHSDLNKKKVSLERFKNVMEAIVAYSKSDNKGGQR